MDGQPSDRCSPAAAGSTSDSKPPASEPLGRARLTSTAEPSSPRTTRISSSCPTCAKSTSRSNASTCSPVASLARTSHKLASVLASLTATAPASGSNSPEPFAYFDPESSSWKTSQASLLPDSESSWPTWPKRGTTQAGRAFEQPTLALPTSESASSSLLPTPGAWLGRRPENSMADPERAKSREHDGIRGKRSVELPDAIAAEVTLLPTPTVYPGETLAGQLPNEIRLLPTPQAADGEGSRNEKTAMGSNAGLRPSGAKATLPLPTAIAMRETISETPFSGASTNLPSDDGSPSADDQLPGQLTIGDV